MLTASASLILLSRRLVVDLSDVMAAKKSRENVPKSVIDDWKC